MFIAEMTIYAIDEQKKNAYMVAFFSCLSDESLKVAFEVFVAKVKSVWKLNAMDWS